jgi:hypothetical protein
MMMNPDKKATYNNVTNLISALESMITEHESERLEDVTYEGIANLLKAAQNAKVRLESHY